MRCGTGEFSDGTGRQASGTRVRTPKKPGGLGYTHLKNPTLLLSPDFSLYFICH